MGYYTQLHVSSFSVGQLIQHTETVFKSSSCVDSMQLILSFIKVERSQLHTPDNLPDAGTNVMGARSNIERMM